MIAAIPTTYRDIRFRSRLEARWAAFFDGIAAPWSYEPIDLRGWIPDFRMIDPDDDRCFVLIDTKPARAFPADVGDKIARAITGPDSVPVRWDGYVFAEQPMPFPPVPSARLVGWHCTGLPLLLCETQEDGGALGFLIWSFGRISVAPFFPGWLRIQRPPRALEGGEVRIDRLWARASNATQWRAP